MSSWQPDTKEMNLSRPCNFFKVPQPEAFVLGKKMFIEFNYFKQNFDYKAQDLMNWNETEHTGAEGKP